MGTSITLDDIAHAERLAVVAYTDGERAQVLDSVCAQAGRVAERRAVDLQFELGPALRFDPRLPGWKLREHSERDKSSVRPPASPAPAPTLPSADADIAFAGLTTLAHWIRSGVLTSRRLTDIYLARIASLDPSLLCWTAIVPERARAEADAADALLRRGSYMGPLHGIPYGAKDIIDTAGVATEWGAEPFRGRVPDADAHVVDALREAGAVLLGKTSTGALALGWVWDGNDRHPAGGAGEPSPPRGVTTRNPWDAAKRSGGSSAGSGSAVSAGLCAFALGSDTMGSTTQPARECGCVGLRGTYGRVSVRGVMLVARSLDKVTVLARDVAGCALALAAMATRDARDPYQLGDAPPVSLRVLPAVRPLAGLRIGIFTCNLESHKDAALLREAARVVERLGGEVVELERAALPYHVLSDIVEVEAAATFEELTLSGRDDQLAYQAANGWPNRWRAARLLSAVDYAQLDRFRRLVMREMGATLARVDVVLGPSFFDDAMRVATSCTGHPTVCFPTGWFHDTPNTDSWAAQQYPARSPNSLFAVDRPVR